MSGQSHWIEVSVCPLCKSAETMRRWATVSDTSGFDHFLSACNLYVLECARCFLLYKNMVPAISALINDGYNEQWINNYHFPFQVEAIKRYSFAESFDLLDIGASDGGFLRAVSGSAGRRSALDIVQHPGILESITGEFILGSLEASNLQWSGVPYDVVTLFDVLEHLYDPVAAMTRAAEFLKPGGLLFIETGDSGSHWPHAYGPEVWYYSRIIHHHIFWSERSISFLADHLGLAVLGIERISHKRSRMTAASTIRQLLKSAVYRMTPNHYAKLASLLRKSQAQPVDPLAKDHLFIVLRT